MIVDVLTRRNVRALTLLRAIEMFVGDGVCPVCGSPDKWTVNSSKPPTDKQKRDLHDDKCELNIMIAHFEFNLRNPGLW